jgi:hypothetical protein
VTIDHVHPRATGVRTCVIMPFESEPRCLLAAFFKIGQTARQWPLPGHAIAGCAFKTSIVMLPVLMVKASATSRTSFVMVRSPLGKGRVARHM